MAKSLVTEYGSSCIINIDVIPDAPRTGLGKINEWRGAIQIKVAALPREGKANEELLRFLSEKIGVPRSSVRVLRGGTSRHKVVVVDAPKHEVEKALGVVSC